MTGTGSSRRCLCHQWAMFMACLCIPLLLSCGGEAYVAMTRTPGEPLPRPDQVVVYDFAVTPGDIKLDRGVGPSMVRDMGNTTQTEEEIRVGRAVAEALAIELVDDLQSQGIRAYRAIEAPPPSSTTLSVKGHFRKIDQGNRTTRTVVGFRLGGSQLGTSIQIYQGVGSRQRLVSEAEAATESSLKPGITSLFTETFVSAIKTDAKRTAKAIAKKFGNYYKRQGWIAK